MQPIHAVALALGTVTVAVFIATHITMSPTPVFLRRVLDELEKRCDLAGATVTVKSKMREFLRFVAEHIQTLCERMMRNYELIKGVVTVLAAINMVAIGTILSQLAPAAAFSYELVVALMAAQVILLALVFLIARAQRKYVIHLKEAGFITG